MNFYGSEEGRIHSGRKEHKGVNSKQTFEDVCKQFLVDNEDLVEKSPKEIYLHTFMSLLEHLLDETCQYARCHHNNVNTLFSISLRLG